MKYVFGPVPSRRLGRSLGVDLVPYKHCSFDCVYCQLGATRHKTVERKRFVDIGDVISELELVVPHVRADYITMSGSGEPTLFLGLGELIQRIKRLTEIPVAGYHQWFTYGLPRSAGGTARCRFGDPLS